MTKGTVVLVYQRADNGKEDTGEEETIKNAQETGWRKVAINGSISMPIILLELEDAKVILADGTMPAGHYQKIRLVLEENTNIGIFNYVVCSH